ncbi:MAG: DNA recombination protein RmuC, partial [Spirochaetaceae bacterium]|nr:DNA recombination protein RmuC [Spirochaetaceae bacterium]
MDIALLVGLVLVLIVQIILILIALRSKPPRYDERFALIESGQERVDKSVREEIGRNRDESARAQAQGREELKGSLEAFRSGLLSTMSQLAEMQKVQLAGFQDQLAKLTTGNEAKLDTLRETIDRKLGLIQADNAEKLEKMRATVDEKLHQTLETRLGESFKLVSERLELVQKGLGEMQGLATGVGDLKRVLTNVKTRGTWGEVALESIIEDILTPAQFEKNVATKKGSAERVEFAIKLPGKGPADGDRVLLPVDAKFPKEDYERLLDAQERGDVPGIEEAHKALALRLKASAKDIRDKYLNPPATTDFGIMFLPSEGLYAESLRRAGLVESLQKEYRVIVTGPTTLAAILNSLQMGFR